MSAITLRCICGKSYTVPAGKAGKRLQCRRCGNVQRIPRPEPPAAGGGLELADEPSPRPQRPGLERGSMRRCPACGLQDEAGVVICVRCGYDWRTGKRLQEAGAHDAAADDAPDGLQLEVDRLSSMTWLALSPLGLVVGPFILWRSKALTSELRRQGRHSDTRPLGQVRLTAAAGAALWLVVGLLFGVLASSRANRSAAETSTQCRVRLEAVGRAVRAALSDAGELPAPGETFPEALRRLVQGGAGGDALACPSEDGLYPYRGAELKGLTAGASPRALLLWDARPHPDELGREVYRALRVDGTVEVFAGASQLAQGTQRPLFPDLAGERPPPNGGSPGVGPSPSGGGDDPPEDLERHMTRLLAFSFECDDRDPGLSELRVSRETFLKRLGLAPELLLSRALSDPDSKHRLAAARLSARLDVPEDEVAGLLEPLAQDPVPEVRLVVAVVRHRRGAPEWLELVCDVAETGDPGLRERALAMLGEAASASAEETERVLREAASLRARIGASGDDAIFPLPTAALPHVQALLGSKLTREAQAVLYTAGAEALPFLKDAVGSMGGRGQEAALATLFALQQQGLLTLEEYQAEIERASDGASQARAVRRLTQASPAASASLGPWALRVLRKGFGDPQLLKALETVLPHLSNAELLDALLERGDHRHVFDELASRSRQGDDSLELHLLEIWGQIPEAKTRQELAKLVNTRLHPNSVRVLLVAWEDPDETVRLVSARGVLQGKGLLSVDVLPEVASQLAKRLDAEESARVRPLLYQLADLSYLCADPDEREEHVCERSLQRTLRDLARRGDGRALASLARHRNEKVAGILLRLLDAAHDAEDKDTLARVTDALRSQTSSGETSMQPERWKAVLKENRQRLRELQGMSRATELKKLERRQQAAQTALERVQGGG